MGFQNLSYWTMVHNFHQQQFEHITSSPYFLQSNGEAERAVRTIKRLLNKKGDPYLALPAYRITPLEIGYSPLQLLMSRLLRTAMSSTQKHVVEAKSTWFHFCANKRSTAQVQTEEKLWHPPWRQRVVTPQSRRYCLGSWPEQWGSRYSNQVDNYSIRSLQIVPSEETAKTWLFFLIQMQLLPVMRSRIRMIQMIWMQSIRTLEQNNPCQSSRTARAPDRLDPSWTKYYFLYHLHEKGRCSVTISYVHCTTNTYVLCLLLLHWYITCITSSCTCELNRHCVELNRVASVQE